MRFSIWIGNLGKYNEGYLVGEWVDLPLEDDIEDIFTRIGIDVDRDEYFVADIDLDYPIFEYCEYPSISTLEEWSGRAVEAETYGEEALEKAQAAYEAGVDDDFFGLLEKADEWMVYDADLGHPGELAAEIAAQFGSVKDAFGESNLNLYFDYETFGQDYRWEAGSDDYIVNSCDKDFDIGWRVVEEFYGCIENVPDEEKERYFDYRKFEKDLQLDGTYISFGQYGRKTLAIY